MTSPGGPGSSSRTPGATTSRRHADSGCPRWRSDLAFGLALLRERVQSSCPPQAVANESAAVDCRMCRRSALVKPRLHISSQSIERARCRVTLLEWQRLHRRMADFSPSGRGAALGSTPKRSAAGSRRRARRLCAPSGGGTRRQATSGRRRRPPCSNRRQNKMRTSTRWKTPCSAPRRWLNALRQEWRRCTSCYGRSRTVYPRRRQLTRRFPHLRRRIRGGAEGVSRLAAEAPPEPEIDWAPTTPSPSSCSDEAVWRRFWSKLDEEPEPEPEPEPQSEPQPEPEPQPGPVPVPEAEAAPEARSGARAGAGDRPASSSRAAVAGRPASGSAREDAAAAKSASVQSAAAPRQRTDG